MSEIIHYQYNANGWSKESPYNTAVNR